MIIGNPITLGGKKAEGTISITANGTYDVTKYASANVNVVSAPVLLWTNASPTSSFAAQTVSVAGGYDGYLVELKYDNSANNYHTTTFTAVGSGQKFYAIAMSSYTWYGRHITPNNGNLVFGNTYSNYSNSNLCATPTRIWGVKFTL